MRCTSLFGVPGAFPATRSPDDLLAQARGAAAEAATRAAAASAQGADAGTVVEAVFGRGFTFLERFVPAPGAPPGRAPASRWCSTGREVPRRPTRGWA